MTTLSMRRGKAATFTLSLTTAAGAALDLSNLDATFTAKRELFDSDDDAVISRTLEVVDAEAGTARLVIDPDETRDLDVSSLYWDVVVDPDGITPRSALNGRLVIRPAVLLGS